MKSEEKIKLKELALKNITENFKTIKKKAKNETLYGFGVGLVEDLTGFFTVANTIESLKRQKIENGKLDKYYLWYISEWEYGGEYSDNNAIYNLLSEITKDFDFFDERYDVIRKEYEEILIETLKECKEKGLFDEQIVVYLHYADCFNENIDDISSKIINSEKLHNLFLNRWSENKENNLTEIIMDKVRNIE